MTDKEIKNDVLNRLATDARVDSTHIELSVTNGIVTLSGTVQSNIALEAADSDAWLTKGVTDVDNRLIIKYPATQPIPSDDELKQIVQSALTWEPDIDASTIHIQVVGGIVSLEGSVDAFWKKFHAEDKVMGISGVLGIENKLAVVPTKSLTDESIAEILISAMENHREIDVEALDIRVENGMVTLSGRVPDLHAKRHAYQVARHTEGVTDVMDNISIGP